MEKNSTNLLLAFVAGAAIGVALGFVIASGKAEDWISDLKDKANKVKDEVEDEYEHGKKLADELRSSFSEVINDLK